MSFLKTRKTALVFLVLITLFSISNNIFTQNIDLLRSGSKKAEKDLWKNERLNYYLDSQETSEIRPESYFYRAQEKLQKGLYKDAIEDYKKAIREDNIQQSAIATIEEGPSNKSAYLSISICFQQLKQIDSALYYCQKSIEEDKYYEDAYLQKAFIYIEEDKLNDALSFLAVSEEIFPNSKTINHAKASIYLQQGNVYKSKRYLKKAINIDHDFEEAQLMLISIYIASGDMDAALRLINKAINAGKKPILSLYYRSYFYLYKNEIKKAYQDIERAYLLDTINSPIASTLVSYDFYFENYKRAIRLGLKTWNENNIVNEEFINKISYTAYEFGYFLNYVNSDNATESEVEIFNKYNYNDLHGKDFLNITDTKKYADVHQGSMFAKRLSIYSDLIFYSGSLQYNETYESEVILDSKLIEYTVRKSNSDKIDHVNSILELDSTIISLYWAKAMLEFKRANYDTAIIIANKAISIDSSFLEPYKIRAFSELHLGNYDNALQHLLNLYDQGSEFFNYSQYIAYAYFQQNNFEKALEYYMQYNSRKSNALSFSNIGLCHENNNIPDSALKYYELAHKEDIHKSSYIRSKVRVYKNLGEYNKALEILEKASKKEHSDFMFLVDIADLFVEMGEYENAIASYKKIYRKDNSYAYAYLNAAECYKELGQYEKTFPLYEIAIEKLPYYAYIHYVKSVCYYELQDFDKSIQSAYKATQLDTEYSKAYQMLANNYFYLGRYSLSISFCLKALNYTPTFKDAMYQIAAAKLAKGEIEQSKELYKKIILQEDQMKSTAYENAMETLDFMIANNIQSENAKLILETVFNNITE